MSFVIPSKQHLHELTAYDLAEFLEKKFKDKSLSKVKSLYRSSLAKETPFCFKIRKASLFLLQKHEKNFHSTASKVKRFVLIVLKYILYFTVIGIPLALKIREKEQAWANKLNEFNQLKHMASLYIRKEKQFSKFYETEIKKISQTTLKLHLEEAIVEELQKSEDNILNIFKKDFNRLGIPFVRIFDPSNMTSFYGMEKNNINLDDIYSYHIDGLRRIFDEENENNWFKLAQVNITQIVLAALFFPISVKLNYFGSTKFTFDADNIKHYFQIQDDKRSVDIKVVRDSKNQINKFQVNVTIQGFLTFFFDTETKRISDNFKKVQLSMSYDISSQNDRVKIENFKFQT